MILDNPMTTTIEKGGASTIDIDGVPMDIWVKFLSQFECKPTSRQLSRNKNRMRTYLEGDLLGRPNGDLFSLFIVWNVDKYDDTKYHVVVAIFEIDPPPGSTTPPPTPPPSGPGKM